MSFKREGDDQSQLNILKKRRVADLLSNFIPEDEAALMKNGRWIKVDINSDMLRPETRSVAVKGFYLFIKHYYDMKVKLTVCSNRYTCLVCSYRPVFDTVDTLTVHRNGKRHLEGLKAFYGKKARLKNEITKRQHEKFVQSEDTGQEPSCSAPLLEQTRKLTHHALLKTVPYNSCHTKTSTKSEKGSLKIGSDPNVNSSSKTASERERERVCRETAASNSSSQSSSSVCAAAGEGSRPSADMTGAAEPLTAQRRRELEHYLKLKSDGWLQDRSGRWVKDENVEFDSDEEEEPPSLTPLPSDH